MAQSKVRKREGRCTLREEISKYFHTYWTLEQGMAYLQWIETMPPQNKKLLELLKNVSAKEVSSDSQN